MKKMAVLFFVMLMVFYVISCSRSAFRTAGSFAGWTYVTSTIINETPKIVGFFSKEEKWSKLQIGDSVFKVKKLLGEPIDVQKDGDSEKWIYQTSNTERRTVNFKNGFLTSIGIETK
jgi:outer membrane protein assembly factor BamE (lipoprotein component of BamABCDE complex)